MAAGSKEEIVIRCPGCGAESNCAPGGTPMFNALIKVVMERPLYVVEGMLVADYENEDLSDHIDIHPKLECLTCGDTFPLPAGVKSVYSAYVTDILNRPGEVAKEAADYDHDIREFLDEEEQTRGAHGQDTTKG